MKFSEMTLEQMKELEEELLEKEDDYYQHVLFYEELLRKTLKLARNNKEKYSDELNYIKRFLTDYLIKYGAYLKMIYQKDDYTAEASLKRALIYDKENPIARYRLGFLAYKNKKYLEACTYFESALQYDCSYLLKVYKLNSRQKQYSQMYLTNSALHIAANSYKNLESFTEEDYVDPLPNLELSPFYEYLNQNEKFMSENAFYKVTEIKKISCSKENCEETFDRRHKNTIYLYFQDQGTVMAFNNNIVPLSPQSADKLRYLLLKSSAEKPANREALKDTFTGRDVYGNVALNTFIQSMRRLRGKLDMCGIPNVIETVSYREETAYFFNRACPFVVMYRTDDLFELDDQLG